MEKENEVKTTQPQPAANMRVYLVEHIEPSGMRRIHRCRATSWSVCEGVLVLRNDETDMDAIFAPGIWQMVTAVPAEAGEYE